LKDRDVQFVEAQFRIATQDAWVRLSGLEMQMSGDPDNRIVTFKHSLPASISGQIPSGRGRLSITPEATISPPRVAGAYILTSTWFEIEDDAGLTLDAISRRFV